jgi:hypothetical protein
MHIKKTNSYCREGDKLIRILILTTVELFGFQNL